MNAIPEQMQLIWEGVLVVWFSLGVAAILLGVANFDRLKKCGFLSCIKFSPDCANLA